VVSKAEGRVVPGDRGEALAAQTQRVVATRGATKIVRTHHGLVMAAAGIDASNTPPGTVVLLPEDPGRSARGLRERLAGDHGVNVAVVVTDTSGRAWRNGQTDIAIGAAGLEVIHDYGGRTDDYGNTLAVTAPAVADEIAAAGDLVKGKLGRTPVAVLRGLDHLVLPRGEHGPGAAALVRPETHDMFGYGAREAVLHAVLPGPGPLPGFGLPASAADLAAALSAVCPGSRVDPAGERQTLELVLVTAPGPAGQRALGAAEARATTVAHALGWQAGGEATQEEGGVRLRFLVPNP